MNERENGYSKFLCVAIFFFCIANAVFCNGSIAATEYKDVVIAFIDYSLNDIPLAFIRCDKRLHAGWNAIHFPYGLNNFGALTD
ncbi:hypothetical protein FG93_05461 [Bosea sp. LC85]|nr:hypothetical protein FG93_05461 [Bosea sp. LC85]